MLDITINDGKSDRELIIQLYCQTSNEIIYWNQMANEKVFEISKQLLGAGVISIPLIGTFVATEGHLFKGASNLIELSLLLIFFSIILGIAQLDFASKFYNNYATYNSNRANALLENRDKTLNTSLEKADEANKSKPNATGSGLLLNLQSYTLGIGLIAMGIVIIVTALNK